MLTILFLKSFKNKVLEILSMRKQVGASICKRDWGVPLRSTWLRCSIKEHKVYIKNMKKKNIDTNRYKILSLRIDAFDFR